MRNGALRNGNAARQRHCVLDMRCAHDARRISRHVREQLAEVHVLLRERVDEVVIGQSGDRDHRGLVELGVIEPIEKMHATGPGGGEAAA